MEEAKIVREFPITKEIDVVVCGGGTAGTVAAIMAARNGARVLILESSGSLGGTCTNGGVDGFHGMKRHWKGAKVGRITGGIALEIRDRLIDKGAAFGPDGEPVKGDPKDVRYDPELFRLLMDEMCEEAGVQVYFQTYVIDAVKEDQRVTGVTYVNKSGIGAIRSKVTIDATGDGDVCTSAGAEYMTLRMDDRPAPMSLIFNMGGMHHRLPEQFGHADGDTRVKFLREAHKKGQIDFAEGADNFGFFGVGNTIVRDGQLREGMGRVNMDMIYNCDATDVEQLSKAWRYGRKRMFEIAHFLRDHVEGCEDAFVVYSSPMLGIRDTRNIVGDYVLTEEDFKACREFPDAVGQSGRAMNVHPPFGVAEEKDRQWVEPYWTEIPKPFEIPYRALLPKGLDNILVAGRCISATGLMQGSIRGQAQCMITGQAAGTAAAIAVKHQSSPRSIDVAELQSTLRKQGAIWGPSPGREDTVEP